VPLPGKDATYPHVSLHFCNTEEVNNSYHGTRLDSPDTNREELVRSNCNSIRKAAIPLCGLVVLILSGCGGGDGGGAAQPSTAENLYSFGSSSTDAAGPDRELFLGTDGNFYGTTSGGGIGGGTRLKGGPFNGDGTVFKITPTGAETVLHSFADSPADGANSQGLTQGSDGNFYGTTLNGGANQRGTVFKLTPEGVESILHSFAGGSDGDHPVGGLVQGTDGNFYGMAINYFENSNGMVFKLTPEGVLTRLHTFIGGSDGAFPSGRLLQGSDGNFYGMTTQGGPDNRGTVFKVTPEGVETVLHSFSGGSADGAGPQNARLIQGSDGNLYGTTTNGGAQNFGTVFKITPEAVETVLYSFSGLSDGAYPLAGLFQGSDGNFYGTTSAGGMNDGGTIFKLAPAGVVTVLYPFSRVGDQPLSNLAEGSDGNLYGTTYEGGANSSGYFFRFVLN
jgi:uncharacterized repeat protein (TIGR03803 family)